MRVMLCTLCLNEMEWLPKLYVQHAGWPGLVSWCFVEAADRAYAETNPKLVSNGLSVDGTSQYLKELVPLDHRVMYIPFGISGDEDPMEGKRAARNAYLEHAEKMKPDYIVILDADEFYTLAHQRHLNDLVAATNNNAYVVRYRTPWRPPSQIDERLFQNEVIGGVWGIDNCHVWRWQPGLRHHTHCSVSNRSGSLLYRNPWKFRPGDSTPECVHLGFSSAPLLRVAKHNYYAERGENESIKRRWYMECRRAWEQWVPGDKLPHGATVIPYEGGVPEIFYVKKPRVLTKN